MAGTLVLVRHGESRWNVCNRFTGWVDVPLSENGIKEAQKCARHCTRYNFKAAFTSALGRAEATAQILLSEQGSTGVIQHPESFKYERYERWVDLSNRCNTIDIPVVESDQLNERFYGSLQGMDKTAAEKRYGKKKVRAWRRGYSARPPGGGESLADVVARTIPYVKKHVLPRLKRGEEVLLVGHGNTLRAIIKYVEKISDENIAFVNLPEAHPIAYSYARGTFTRIEGDYRLDRPFR